MSETQTTLNKIEASAKERLVKTKEMLKQLLNRKPSSELETVVNEDTSDEE